MSFRLLLLVAVAAAALPLPAAGQTYVRRGDPVREGRTWVETIECGTPVAEGGRLVLRADVGAVAVKTGAERQLTCLVRLRAYASDEQEARLILSRYDITLSATNEQTVQLRGRWGAGTPPAPPAPPAPRPGSRVQSPRAPMPPLPPPGAARLKVEYEVRVPTRFNLELETRGGEISVERLQGELRAVTAGGSIRTDDISGPVRAETAGGSIVLGNIGNRVEARTAGGAVRVGDVQGDAILETSGGEIIAGRITGGGRAATAGGDILLRAAGGDLTVVTAGGQIRLGEVGGRVRAETAGGSIQLDSARGPVQVETAGGCINLDRVDTAVRAATVAGKIRAQITASRESFANSVLETAFGDVEVYLPTDLPITIDAVIQNASGHSIVSDFPLQIDKGGPGVRSRVIEGRGALNGGGQVLRIRTTAGNIEIRRLDTRQLEQLEEKQNSLWKRWLLIRKSREKDKDKDSEKPNPDER